MRCWAEVSLDTIVNNYRIYVSKMPAGCGVMAVVKANAYGHGAVKAAEALQAAGCTDFAVATADEGIELRNAKIKGQILILGYTSACRAPELAEYELTQALVSAEDAGLLAAACRKAGVRVKVQFGLDTGMNRIGLDADLPEECIAEIDRWKASPDLELTGIFTHMCVADSMAEENKAFTKLQIDKFKAVSTKVDLQYKHYLNSAAGVWSNEGESSFARLGIILYGYSPDNDRSVPEGIRPALEWKARVAMVKALHPGETVGYGRTFKAEREMKIATVTVGYADGYSRLLSNKGYVLIRGCRAPIVGRVCMDQMMVDVSGIENVCADDEAVLLGTSGKETITADDMADMTNTISYEILCDISQRVTRVYI